MVKAFIIALAIVAVGGLTCGGYVWYTNPQDPYLFLIGLASAMYLAFLIVTNGADT